MSKIDLKDIQQKLYEGLKESGWADRLKGFILSDDFYQILETLLRESQDGKRFTPVLKQLFRAFHECPYEDLKVIIIGQDPYPKAGVADGISFSCSNTDKEQPSLRYMFKEINETVYMEMGRENNPDLTRWSNQGILMLNTALTCEVGNIGSHVELWKPFTTYLLDMLSSYNSGLVYVFLGNYAKAWAKSVNQNNFKIFTTHPASAAYRKGQRWDSNDMFNTVSKLVKDHYKYDIKW